MNFVCADGRRRRAGACCRRDRVGRRSRLGAVAVLVAVLLGACRGGDTNQPASPPAATSASTTPAEGAAAEAEADVRAAFVAYKEALLDGDTATALDAVSSATVDYFTDMQSLGARGGPEEIKARSMGDRFFVTLVREQVARDELATMSGEGLFIYGVEHGLISADTVAQMDLGDIEVSSESALAVVVSSGEISPSRFRFVRESGRWKVDLVYLLRLLDAALRQVAASSGLGEDEFIFERVAIATGRPVPPDIWARPTP